MISSKECTYVFVAISSLLLISSNSGIVVFSLCMSSKIFAILPPVPPFLINCPYSVLLINFDLTSSGDAVDLGAVVALGAAFVFREAVTLIAGLKPEATDALFTNDSLYETTTLGKNRWNPIANAIIPIKQRMQVCALLLSFIYILEIDF